MCFCLSVRCSAWVSDSVRRKGFQIRTRGAIVMFLDAVPSVDAAPAMSGKKWQRWRFKGYEHEQVRYSTIAFKRLNGTLAFVGKVFLLSAHFLQLLPTWKPQYFKLFDTSSICVSWEYPSLCLVPKIIHIYYFFLHILLHLFILLLLFTFFISYYLDYSSQMISCHDGS